MWWSGAGQEQDLVFTQHPFVPLNCVLCDHLSLPAGLELFGFRTAIDGMSVFPQIHILKPNPQRDCIWR